MLNELSKLYNIERILKCGLKKHLKPIYLIQFYLLVQLML